MAAVPDALASKGIHVDVHFAHLHISINNGNGVRKFRVELTWIRNGLVIVIVYIGVVPQINLFSYYVGPLLPNSHNAELLASTSRSLCDACDGVVPYEVARMMMMVVVAVFSGASSIHSSMMRCVSISYSQARPSK